MLSGLKFSPDFIEREVGHEGTHWRTAIELGFSARVGVRLVKRRSLGGFRQSLTAVEIPDDLIDELVRQKLGEIFSAPGTDMSDSDKSKLYP